jgi:hypothetical protein
MNILCIRKKHSYYQEFGDFYIESGTVNKGKRKQEVFHIVSLGVCGNIGINHMYWIIWNLSILLTTNIINEDAYTHGIGNIPSFFNRSRHVWIGSAPIIIIFFLHGKDLLTVRCITPVYYSILYQWVIICIIYIF